MRTIFVDGRPVAVNDEMPGDQLTEMVGASPDQFAVIVREGNPSNPPMRVPIQKSPGQSYPISDNDMLQTMYRVPNGRRA